MEKVISSFVAIFFAEHTLLQACKQYSRKLFCNANPCGPLSHMYFWHESSTEFQTSPIDFSISFPFTSTEHVEFSAIEKLQYL